MSSYALPYGRKQLDNIIVFNNNIWTGTSLEKLRWEIFQRLPVLEKSDSPSEEEAKSLFYKLEAVICLLEQVPADTRELSISYAEHVRNIEQYFCGVVKPSTAPSYKLTEPFSPCAVLLKACYRVLLISSIVCSTTMESS